MKNVLWHANSHDILKHNQGIEDKTTKTDISNRASSRGRSFTKNFWIANPFLYSFAIHVL